MDEPEADMKVLTNWGEVIQQLLDAVAEPDELLGYDWLNLRQRAVEAERRLRAIRLLCEVGR